METDMQLDERLAFMEKYGLTAGELLFVRMAMLSREGGESQDLVRKYYALKKEVRGDAREILNSLKSKRLVLKDAKLDKDGRVIMSSPLFTQSFEKDYHRSALDMGRELFEAYPMSCVVNGMEFKLRRISKKFNSLEQAFFAYGKYIGWSPERHRQVIDLVEAGKNSGYAFSTLGDFIVDNDWLNLEEMADKGKLTSNMRML